MSGSNALWVRPYTEGPLIPGIAGCFGPYGAVHAWSAGGPAVAEVAGNREFAALWEAL